MKHHNGFIRRGALYNAVIQKVNAFLSLCLFGGCFKSLPGGLANEFENIVSSTARHKQSQENEYGTCDLYHILKVVSAVEIRAVRAILRIPFEYHFFDILSTL